MRIAIKTRPEHTSWAELRDVWIAADDIELFESAWTWDHFYPLTGDLTGPNLEGWTSLSALAHDRGAVIPRDTRTVVTPGGGQHLYFRLPPDVDLRNTAGYLGRHVDTRGTGGYVVGPGSIINGRRYRLTVNAPPHPMPDWLLKELLPKSPATAAPLVLPTSTAYVDAVLRGEAARVEQAAVGTRNQTLFRAAARLGSFVAQGRVAEDVVISVLEHACRRHPDFGHREVARTIASGLRRAARNPPASDSTRPGPASLSRP